MSRQQEEADAQVIALASFLLGFALLTAGAVYLLGRRVGF